MKLKMEKFLDMHSIIPVILSGGSGTRLWPLSREQYPKQYLSLTSNNTMLQETILRLNGLNNLMDPIIVCNAEHRFLVAEQCQQIDIENPIILLEPVGKNTAPAIAVAALQSIKDLDDAVLLVLSADQVIRDISAFHGAVNIAYKQAQKSKLVTFGIVPTNANTDYGYIKLSQENSDGAYKVERFVEKPDLRTAESYLKQDNYLWNGGMFMFQASTLIRELTDWAPDIVKAANNAVDNATQDLDFIRLDEQAFKSSPSESIDYALMEKSKNIVVVSLDAQWNDVGSWSALYDIGKKDDKGNVVQGDVITKDTVNTYINATNHLVVAIGVQDLVIVDTPNATLISTQDKSQEVKKIVEHLQSQGREEQFCHRKVYRPWGWYDVIESGEHFQVKKLHINPGAKLSLQYHNQRAEHWVVVKGVANVVNGDKVISLIKGESTYIPVGTRHSLENTMQEYLEIIEIQSGSYLGEDDIVRLEDSYGRK